ncbi:hypothetical protein HY632_01725 [Candidatus Uhrbacteria bacterium]|nr:hypothetical protein [Candidatus Uhrbacteria bacterium]
MLFDWLSQHVRSNWPHKKFADGITWFPPGKSPLEIVAHLTSATPTEHVLARGDATRVLRNRDQFEVDQHRILALCAETNEQDRDAFACAETLMRILITIHHHIASEREWV